ncbi:MAG: FAD:protein FMN transferase [Pirellulales bacterium]|nr:FAD:protein FMN transferase [Pirellulales bacterium]
MNRSLLIAVVGLLANFGTLSAEEAEMLQLRGETMGTLYTVKIFDPPEFSTDVRFAVDAELRSVNDQMSTYLKSSELSRFNASESTDWFPVSEQTASVVEFALQVSEQTAGAFDVTVGPLVNLWGFGPDQRPPQVPQDQTIEEVRSSVGYQKLSVRTKPPALRKTVAGLQVDLSALAKGHGVDRVIQLLQSMGAANCFVEIGGEVRTSGSKDGQPWVVGIQLPDADQNQVIVGHPLGQQPGQDDAMATSGDYRNFFESGGQRYSHTMDPRTGRPVEHSLASVSVVAGNCMAADAWATALSVTGREEGLQLAREKQMHVLIVDRTNEGFVLSGTGVLADYSDPKTTSADTQENASGGVGRYLIVVAALTFSAFGLVLLAMATGVLFGRRAISGSCGGLANTTGDDGSVSCSLCSNPGDACKELREKMQREKVES